MTLVMTCTPNQRFKVLDCVFAIDSHKQGFFADASPDQAFAGVKKELSSRCEQIGGDAVIACQFEYRVAVSEGWTGSKQVIEILLMALQSSYWTDLEKLESAVDSPAAAPLETALIPENADPTPSRPGPVRL